MKRLAPFLVLFVLTFPAAAQRRRAAAKPSIDATTVAGWLVANAHPLISVDAFPYSYDLDPLRAMIGNATTVGLADDTHGTHEFFTLKLRLIDYLVRELGFETVAFEAVFPQWQKLNTYVRGGPGDPRAVLAAQYREHGYFFWNAEEVLAVIEWMREYNLHRGKKPPVEVVGFDIYDETTAAADVVAYLAPLDPPFAAQAQTSYQCLDPTDVTDACRASIVDIRNRLAARRNELATRTSTRAFDDAVESATIVVDRYRPDVGFVEFIGREPLMAEHVLWVKEHRGTNRKTILWGHQEHLGKTRIRSFGDVPSMGMYLADTLGSDYFVIGTCTWSGTFAQWLPSGSTVIPMMNTLRPAGPESYEAMFRSAGLPRMLIPLRGAVPAWLEGPRAFRTAATTPQSRIEPDQEIVDSLPQKLDAIVYIETTTPIHALPH